MLRDGAPVRAAAVPGLRVERTRTFGPLVDTATRAGSEAAVEQLIRLGDLATSAADDIEYLAYQGGMLSPGPWDDQVAGLRELRNQIDGALGA